MKIRIVEHEKRGKAIATIDNAKAIEILSDEDMLKVRYYDDDGEIHEVTGSMPDEITIIK